MTITLNERIERYRLVYRYATDEKVNRRGLSGDIDRDEATLIERINTKTRKHNGYTQPVTLQTILDWYS